MTKIAKAQLILIICGLAIFCGVLGFVMISDIFLSELMAKIVITTALCCFEAALILRIISRFRDGKLPWVSIGVAIGIAITAVQGIMG